MKNPYALIVHPTDFMDDELVRPVPTHMTAVEWQRFRVEGQRKENERRDFATFRVCQAVLMAYTESVNAYAYRIAKGMGCDSLTASLMAASAAPSETTMSMFLIGELDAHPAVARAAAKIAAKWSDPRRFHKEVYEAWEGKPYIGLPF